MRIVTKLALALTAAALLASTASAHSRSVSYSSWQIDGTRARVVLRLALLEISRLTPEVGSAPLIDDALAAELGRYFAANLQLRASGEPCAVAGPPRALAASAGQAAFEWSLDCGERPPDAIRSTLMVDVAPGHLHFARLRRGGALTAERVLSIASPEWPLAGDDAAASAGTSFQSYVALGIEHIATGADHLVFVLALLLLAVRLREVATIITGFTLAHSITLSLAVLGGLRPETRAVEALIGLSIALVAAENAWLQAMRPRFVPGAIVVGLLAMAALAAAGHGALSPAVPAGLAVFALCYFAILDRVDNPVRLRIAIAFVFGLVHGFGFAGVLEAVALPPERLASALFGFNLGVEIGQIAVVALLWPPLRALARVRDGRAHSVFVDAATAAVCGLGIFWLVSRAYAIS